jgi:hypothetical protein
MKATVKHEIAVQAKNVIITVHPPIVLKSRKNIHDLAENRRNGKQQEKAVTSRLLQKTARFSS